MSIRVLSCRQSNPTLLVWVKQKRHPVGGGGRAPNHQEHRGSRLRKLSVSRTTTDSPDREPPGRWGNCWGGALQGIPLPATADPAGLIGQVEGRPHFPQSEWGGQRGTGELRDPPCCPHSADSGPGQRAGDGSFAGTC